MKDVEQVTRQFALEHPDLVPVLHAMLDMAKRGEAQAVGGIGEFSRDWVAAQEPATPRTLRVFVAAGLIQASPRGTGSGRRFYVFVDHAASARALTLTSAAD